MSGPSTSLAALCRLEQEAILALRDRVVLNVYPGEPITDRGSLALQLAHMFVLDEFSKRLPSLLEGHLVFAGQAPKVRFVTLPSTLVGFAAVKSAYHRFRKAIESVAGHGQFSIGPFRNSDGGEGRGFTQASPQTTGDAA